MSFIGSALGGLAAGLLGGGGQKAPSVKATLPNFNAGGLTGTFSGGSYGITPSADRTAAVGGVADTFAQQANDIGTLRGQVAPGMSDFRTAIVNALDNQRISSMGTLRDNLARRRVLGSSFAQDSLSRADQAYAQTKAQALAQTYLQELDASSKLIDQQFTAARGVFQTGLNEMNLEAGLAADLAGKASTSMNNIALANAKMDAEAAAGAGKFFANIGSTLGGGLFSQRPANASFGSTYLGSAFA